MAGQLNRRMLEKLMLFNEKGNEVELQKRYTIEWEIIPHPLVSHLITSNVKGHIVFDPESLQGNFIEVTPENIIIDDGGKFTVEETVIQFSDGTQTSVGVNPSEYSDYVHGRLSGAKLTTATNNILLFDVSTYIERTPKKITNRDESLSYKEQERYYNTVRLTFNTLEESYVKEYPASYIFSRIQKPQYVNNYVEGDETAYWAYFYALEILVLTEVDDPEYNNLLEALINTNFNNNFDALYPGVFYQGVVWQDKVSTDFIASNTLMLFGGGFNRPSFENDENYSYQFFFKFQNNSEMRFISSDSMANLIWEDSNLAENIPPEVDDQGNVIPNDNPPIYFSVGFQTDIEGCYQNLLAMYIRKTNLDPESEEEPQDYLLGLITFFTEVEGEDERYRALLGNFGIPDPVKYANVFKEQDPDEQGIDWILVNQKSKELMISYDNIFPYVGTYKALLGAVRFLGYWDLIFKEWYKIKDKTGRDKFIALQAYDLVKGESLETKLKRINVTFGEFEKYKKLNRLTMIYHLNQIDEETGEFVNYYINTSGSTWKDSVMGKKQIDDKQIFTWIETNSTDGQYFKLPITYKIYQYRTDEILAKLFSVKRWLEKYILGVNCYISDICGEGIIVERLKTQSYATEHYVQDFTVEGKFTPRIVSYGLTEENEFVEDKFDNSKTELRCTLNEFTNLTLEDYSDWTIDKFVINEITKTQNEETATIYVSPPFETLVPATEYQFRAQLNEAESGTLAEFTSQTDISTNHNTILIRDNKILFFNNKNIECFIQDDECPIIEVSKANIRYCHGNWKENVSYSVSVNTDEFTGNEYYMFNSKEGDVENFRSNQKIFFVPIPTIPDTPNNQIFGSAQNINNENYNGLKSQLIYTANNKWKVPMFVMRNYVLRNTQQVIKGDYILEIIEGRMIFRNKQKETGNLYTTEYNSNTNEFFLNPSIGRYKPIGAEVKFGNYYDLEAGEQKITIDYTYLSDRAPIYMFNSSAFKQNYPNISDWEIEENIDKYVSVNKFMHVPVNRLGKYTIQVNAYDQYNNIFVNNSDDETIVHTNHVPLNIVLNQEYMMNEKTFSDRYGYGTKIEDRNYIDNLLNNDIPKLSGQPIHPQNWRIYDIDPVLDSSNTIKYDSLSYAMELPYTGNFILFNNFTEKIVSVEKTGSRFKLGLLDENPNIDTIRYSRKIGICVYDNRKKDIISDICPLQVHRANFVNPILDSSYSYNQSYMEVLDDPDIYTIDGEVVNDISLGYLASSHIIEENKHITAYVYPMTELTKVDVSVNYKENYSIVYSDSQQPQFVIGQLVKICYADTRDIHNHYTKNIIDNETVYRVIDIIRIGGDTMRFGYKLNGIVDIQKTNNKLYHNKAEHTMTQKKISPLTTDSSIIIKMSPAHLHAAQYTLRVSSIGSEMLAYYNGNEMNEITVQYEYMPLLFNEYLDTTYSATVYSYDPYMLDRVFVYDVSTIFNMDDDLYIYKDFPVTVKKGRTMILYPDETDTKLSKVFDTSTVDVFVPWRIDWNWQSYIIDDLRNCPNLYLDLVNKQSIFKSTNPILPVKPELLGTQSPEMWVTDVYGNRLINYAGGFIYVDENEDYVYNRQEEGTRPIYYRDVYIVGVMLHANAPHIMSADGEDTTFTYNLTGGDTDTNQVDVQYTIFYNDGTVQKNEGANVQLLTMTGKKARGNKVKISLSPSEQAHKSVAAEINGYIEFNSVNERDLVKGNQEFVADVYQYGYSKTTDIYDFTFDVNDIPAEGTSMESYVIEEYITNVHYTMKRSEGEIEEINADSLQSANLKIVNVKFIDKYSGLVTAISENQDPERKQIGTMILTVEFYVNGVKNSIRTQGISLVYQKEKIDS